MARILVVEDDVDIMLLLAHVLRSAGYDVDEAGTRRSACELIERGNYDLVLADGKLADGTGMMVADKATASGSKAIIFTGNPYQLPRADLLRYQYLMKPIRGPELLAIVEQLLGAPADVLDLVPQD